MKKLLIVLLGMAFAGVAGAKLPPQSPDAQAKADEAKQKTAWTDKVAAYQLCKAQDRVAAEYRQKKGSQPAPAASLAAPTASGPADAAAAAAVAPAPAPVTPAVAAAAAAIPPCQDPGPYTSAAAAAKVGVADSLPVPAAGKPPTPAEAKK